MVRVGLGWVGLDWKVEGGGGEKRGETMEACGDEGWDWVEVERGKTGDGTLRWVGG